MCAQPTCWPRLLPWAITLKGAKGTRREYAFFPTPKQAEFFEQQTRTKYTLFGGAKAVAKSHALRWGAYRECLRIPGLHVLILRRTFGELEQSHLLYMPMEAEALTSVGAEYKPSIREFSFANRSLIRAGHCETDADLPKFLSSQWDLVVVDEVVTFTSTMFLAITSCARTVNETLKAEGGAKVWGATNPGGRGAAWVKDLFVDHEVEPERFPDYQASEWAFVPGRLEDNPYMEAGYRQTLMNLPPILRRQYLDGDWNAFEGQFFDFMARKDGHDWHVRDMGIAA